jgi:hypothetical protein
MKRSPISILLVVAVLAAIGYGAYYYGIRPWMERRAIEKAVEKGCQEVVQKFDEHKDEIVEDLTKLIEKIEVDMASEIKEENDK